jgi:hypothetical protein
MFSSTSPKILIGPLMGTQPLAGRYHSREEFRRATFVRLAKMLAGGARLRLEARGYLDSALVAQAIAENEP